MTKIKPKTKTRKARSKLEWQRWAEVRLKKLLLLIRSIPELKVKGPSRNSKEDPPWVISLQLVNRSEMIELNDQYRGKAYATDVLSFPTFAPFRNQGFLGDLVICLPILQTQARSQNHTPEIEMEILLIHGVLHLLGFDHEKGVKEAAIMARWESKLSHKRLGLIDRSKSGS